jgi:hypothetical protein
MSLKPPPGEPPRPEPDTLGAKLFMVFLALCILALKLLFPGTPCSHEPAAYGFYAASDCEKYPHAQRLDGAAPSDAVALD